MTCFFFHITEASTWLILKHPDFSPEHSRWGPSSQWLMPMTQPAIVAKQHNFEKQNYSLELLVREKSLAQPFYIPSFSLFLTACCKVVCDSNWRAHTDRCCWVMSRQECAHRLLVDGWQWAEEVRAELARSCVVVSVDEPCDSLQGLHCVFPPLFCPPQLTPFSDHSSYLSSSHSLEWLLLFYPIQMLHSLQ